MPNLLATVEQLRVALKNPATFDETEAEQLLAIASGEVRAATGQLLDYVPEDEIRLDVSDGLHVLLLPETPVLEVFELREGAPGADEVLAGPGSESPVWEWSQDGIIRRLSGRFERRFRWYEVVYEHGWDPIPDEIAGVVLRVAGRAFAASGDTRSETIGRYSYTAAGESAGVGLYPADLDALIPYTLDEKRGHTGTPAGSGAGSGS